MKRSLCVWALVLPLWVAGTSAQQASMPPCEIAPPETSEPPPKAPRAPINLRIIRGGDALQYDDDDVPSGPSAGSHLGIDGGNEPVAISGPHDYYFALASRSDCHRAFSLRNQAQIEQYRRSKDTPSQVTYDFANDRDTRRQDAAKIVIAGNSLATQVWLPTLLSTSGTYFVTWDAWWGKEFGYNLTTIANYKAFQFGSPNDEIWTEVVTAFKPVAAVPEAVAVVEGRAYGGSQGLLGPNITDANPLSPFLARPFIRPEVWGRYFAFWETIDGWDTYSLWYAEENAEPIQIFDRLQLKMREGRSSVFRLEYNTSTNTGPVGRAALVAYVRNLVVLKGISRAETLKLMQKPVR